VEKNIFVLRKYHVHYILAYCAKVAPSRIHFVYTVKLAIDCASKRAITLRAAVNLSCFIIAQVEKTRFCTTKSSVFITF
jgi:hypothetical protein